jgi:hypothetical protein
MIAHSSDYGLFVRPVPIKTPTATISTRTTIPPSGPVQGVKGGFNRVIVGKGLALIITIAIAASIGVLLYRKKNGK